MVRLRVRHNHILIALLVTVLIFSLCGLFYYYNNAPKISCTLDENGEEISQSDASKLELENNKTGLQCQWNSDCIFDKEFGPINRFYFVKYHCKTEGQSNPLIEYLHFSIPVCIDNTCQLIREDNVDHELCRKIVEENISSHYIAGCYNKLALIQSNISVCDIPKDEKARAECHAWIDA
jgi:hypothetical protein